MSDYEDLHFYKRQLRDRKLLYFIKDVGLPFINSLLIVIRDYCASRPESMQDVMTRMLSNPFGEQCFTLHRCFKCDDNKPELEKYACYSQAHVGFSCNKCLNSTSPTELNFIMIESKKLIAENCSDDDFKLTLNATKDDRNAIIRDSLSRKPEQFIYFACLDCLHSFGMTTHDLKCEIKDCQICDDIKKANLSCVEKDVELLSGFKTARKDLIDIKFTYRTKVVIKILSNKSKAQILCPMEHRFFDPHDMIDEKSGFTLPCYDFERKQNSHFENVKTRCLCDKHYFMQWSEIDQMEFKTPKDQHMFVLTCYNCKKTANHLKYDDNKDITVCDPDLTNCWRLFYVEKPQFKEITADNDKFKYVCFE